MSKEDYDEYKIYYDKRQTCNEWEDAIDHNDAPYYYWHRCN